MIKQKYTDYELKPDSVTFKVQIFGDIFQPEYLDFIDFILILYLSIIDFIVDFMIDFISNS